MQLATMIRFSRTAAAAALAAFFSGGFAPLTGADDFTIQLAPIRDNTMYQESGTLSNGAGSHFFAGATQGGTRRRGLLAFDLSGIPASAQILDARLDMFCSRTIVGSVSVELHRAQADWGEAGSDATAEEGQGAPAQPGDATWTHAFLPTTAWTSAGGDFAPIASAISSVGFPGPYAWTGPLLRDDVQAWVSEALPNYGWVVVGAEDIFGSTKRFDSRDNVDPARRPVLTVTYRAPVSVDGTSWAKQKAAYR